MVLKKTMQKFLSFSIYVYFLMMWNKFIWGKREKGKSAKIKNCAKSL